MTRKQAKVRVLLPSLQKDTAASPFRFTVIRPSRARCVGGRIPRRERAVPNSAAHGVGGAHAGHRVRRGKNTEIAARSGRADLPLSGLVRAGAEEAQSGHCNTTWAESL